MLESIRMGWSVHKNRLKQYFGLPHSHMWKRQDMFHVKSLSYYHLRECVHCGLQEIEHCGPTGDGAWHGLNETIELDSLEVMKLKESILSLGFCRDLELAMNK